MACCSRNGDLMWSGFMYLQSWAGATTRPCFQAKKFIVATSIRHRGLNIFRVLFVTETLTRCRVVVVTELNSCRVPTRLMYLYNAGSLSIQQQIALQSRSRSPAGGHIIKLLKVKIQKLAQHIRGNICKQLGRWRTFKTGPNEQKNKTLRKHSPNCSRSRWKSGWHHGITY